MCQRLRVAIRVGATDEEEFYQAGDDTGLTFVGIKWRRRSANQCDFALFGDVSQVRVVITFVRSAEVADNFVILRLCHS